MTDRSLQSPVALLIYKRPNTTQKVFEAIRQAKPAKLLVIANAPHPEKPDEVEKCAATRAIIEQVDWECEVFRNYADTYLSCKERISTGLDWVFSTVESAIILEDDCVPHPSFFQFCDELLERYWDDERITTIAGTSYQVAHQKTEYSYYFSHYNILWGWATWRRAWQYYDVDMKLWPKARDSELLQDILADAKGAAHWSWVFQRTYEGHDTWDDQWTLSCWLQSGLSIVPQVNLISNIGFGADSAHTKDSYDWRANMPLEVMPFPLKHPDFVVRDGKTDLAIQSKYYNFISDQRSLVNRAQRKFRRAKKILQAFQESPDITGIPALVNQLIRE